MSLPCSIVRARWPLPSSSPAESISASRSASKRAKARRPSGAVEIDDEHVDQAVAAGLQLQPAVEFQRRAEQHGERRRFAEKPRDRRRIIVLARESDRSKAPSRTTRPRRSSGSTAKGKTRSSMAFIRDRTRHRRRLRAEIRHSSSVPKHQDRMPFCACRRFSASSKTTDCGPSITSSVTSSPRCAGRQCMKIASFAAAAISLSFT